MEAAEDVGIITPTPPGEERLVPLSQLAGDLPISLEEVGVCTYQAWITLMFCWQRPCTTQLCLDG